MSTRPPLPSRLGLKLPIVQAPMAGVSTAALAGAVTGAGGLGSVAVGASAPETADETLAAALKTGRGMLNVNVFTHTRPRRDVERERAWLRTLQPWFGEFDAQAPGSLDEIYRTFDDQPEMLDVLLAHRPPVVSFHFGLPRAQSIRALKSYGAYLIATATSVAEARQLEAAGIDAIVAQGFEAGGHRGTFVDDTNDECLSTFTLLPRVVGAVDLPVLAAGGISSGAGIAAAQALGASGVQMGTVFIDCPESAATHGYRHALHAEGMTTAITRVFSGRRARGIVNRFVREVACHEREVPDYPVAYDAGKRLAAAATAAGSESFTPMWAGQGPVRPEALPAAELIARLAEEWREAGHQRG